MGSNNYFVKNKYYNRRNSMPLITSTPYNVAPVFVGIDVPTTVTSPNNVLSHSVSIGSFANGTLALATFSVAKNTAIIPPAGWTQVFQLSSFSGNGQRMASFYRVKQPGDGSFLFNFAAAVAMIRWLTGFGSATTASLNGNFNDTGYNTIVNTPATTVDLAEGEKLIRVTQWMDPNNQTPSSGYPPAGHTYQGTLIPPAVEFSQVSGAPLVYITGTYNFLDDQTAGPKAGFTYIITGNSYDMAANIVVKP